MDLTFHRLVQQDLRTVLSYYQSVGGDALADRFFDELTALVAKVAAQPTMFHPLEGGLRRANLANFPFHLVYRERVGTVRILVLRHHRQHPVTGAHRS